MTRTTWFPEIYIEVLVSPSTCTLPTVPFNNREASHNLQCQAIQAFLHRIHNLPFPQSMQAHPSALLDPMLGLSLFREAHRHWFHAHPDETHSFHLEVH
jgi:hypothetical protein